MEVTMKKNWILLAEDGFGISMWEETSSLFWCGGDTYTIVWQRQAYNQPDMNSIVFYNASEISDAWKQELKEYDYLRETA